LDIAASNMPQKQSIDSIPKRPQEIQPHPLGISAHDLLDFAKRDKESRKLSSFLQETFARFSSGKVAELREAVPEVNLDKKPGELTWEEAEKLVNGFKQLKWIAPAMDAIVPIGKEQIEKSFTNIFNLEPFGGIRADRIGEDFGNSEILGEGRRLKSLTQFKARQLGGDPFETARRDHLGKNIVVAFFN